MDHPIGSSSYRRWILPVQLPGIVGLAFLCAWAPVACAPIAEPRMEPVVPTIGVLMASSNPADEMADEMADENGADHLLVQALSRLGYVEGASIFLERRTGPGHAESLARSAAELTALPVRVIVAIGAAIPYARAATNTIPIVMVDVENGATQGIAIGPGGIGHAPVLPDWHERQLALLKDMAPWISQVIVVGPQPAAGAVAARSLGLGMIPVRMDAADQSGADVDAALRSAIAEGGDALLVLGTPATRNQAERISKLAVDFGLPAIAGSRTFIEAGGLAAYGPDARDAVDRAAGYVYQLLQGAKPDEVPIEHPPRFAFVVNRKAAQALGLVLPASLAPYITELAD
jgi:putative tryptophan/tyrosine transport system substrate-binding protein